MAPKDDDDLDDRALATLASLEKSFTKDEEVSSPMKLAASSLIDGNDNVDKESTAEDDSSYNRLCRLITDALPVILSFFMSVLGNFSANANARGRGRAVARARPRARVNTRTRTSPPICF